MKKVSKKSSVNKKARKKEKLKPEVAVLRDKDKFTNIIFGDCMPD